MLLTYRSASAMVGSAYDNHAFRALESQGKAFNMKQNGATDLKAGSLSSKEAQPHHPARTPIKDRSLPMKKAEQLQRAFGQATLDVSIPDDISYDKSVVLSERIARSAALD